MEFQHTSVLLSQSVSMLELKDNSVCVDGTLGGGGHSKCILETYPTSSIIGIDQDETAIKAAKQRLECFGSRVTVVHDNFKNIRSVLENLQIEEVGGAIIDLGVSSYQLDEADRGFSYRYDAPLDMRMDQHV